MAHRQFSSSKPDILIVSDIQDIVRLPPQTDINEWYAVHIVQFYNELALLCSIIRYDNVICNETMCPKMSAGIDFEYLWHSKEFIQPIAVSAPKYIDFLLEWIKELINDKKQFPKLNDINQQSDDNENNYNIIYIDDSENNHSCDEQKNNNQNNYNGYVKKSKKNEYRFPKDFKSLICKICRRIVRVYGHIYDSHFQECISLKIQTYLNTSFQYFLCFIKHHKLVKDKELYPMRNIIKRMYQQPPQKHYV